MEKWPTEMKFNFSFCARYTLLYILRALVPDKGRRDAVRLGNLSSECVMALTDCAISVLKFAQLRTGGYC